MKIILPGFLILIVNFSFNICAQTISTYAGNGSSTFSGNGGPATAAELYYPEGVCVDDSGNVFVADNNNAVWKVSSSTGIIKIIAGTGIGGISPDGGLASVSQILQPLDVAVDDSGNVYFSENGANKIRMVKASTGILSTMAGNGTYGFYGDGGPATAAEIWYPFGLVVDSAQNIYFADEDNYRIRKITHSTGIITTIAGNGTVGYNNDGIQATAAYLNYPAGVALDKAGNVYIADYGNHRVREVSVSSGIISTFAGVGTPGLSGDGGLATAAELNYPAGVAFDNTGNLYIADEHNGEVREVNNLSGIITDVAGNGISGFSGDGGPATAAELEYDYGVAIDNNNNIFIADAQNNRVREVKGVITNAIKISNSDLVKMFPNPANDKVYISGLKKGTLLELYSITGQLIWSENNSANTSITEIPVNNFQDGIYFLRIQFPDGSILAKKIVVQKN
jgi:trimeric autotransporter adhesin